MLTKQNLGIKEDNKMTNEQKLNNIEYVETLSSLAGVSRQAYEIAGVILQGCDLDKEEAQEAIRHANAAGNLAIEAATHWIAIDRNKSVVVSELEKLKDDAIIQRKEMEGLDGKLAGRYYNVYAVLALVVYQTVVKTYVKLISELKKPC